ncbi:MAG: hypothetical protein EON85_08990 [Brevundimonas sp.]|nr:MAG: hypothetical protein EON85_08990 [Brevundimonas sp.]
MILGGVLATALSACASTGERTSPDTTSELAAKCRERGGILVPTGRPSTGRPETDNACQINGGASRIP